MNVDGIERLRKKWSRLGRVWYRMGEYFATKFPNEIVTDCKVIQDYYLEKYNKNSTQIAYGAYTDKVSSTKLLDKFNVKKDEYILYVSRLEPDNNAHVLIEAFEKVKTDKKLVIVGDAPYSSEYIKSLKATTDSRIIFTGYIYGKGYKEFQSHAYLYVHGNEVGGTNPALLEAMGFGNCVLAVCVPYNVEVMGDAGISFTKHRDDLTNKLQDLIDNPGKRESYQKRAVERIKRHYSWEDVTDKYESLFTEASSRGP
jgi:glycosyltransferase involved in cell wall biosynthesis